jgi:hypothetical protein
VTKNTDAPLELVVKVTPLPTAGESNILPMFVDRFTVRGTVERDLVLPRPSVVRGNVRLGKSTLEAEITFTASQLVAGLASSPIGTSTVAGVHGSALDFEVRLQRGMEYRMLVRPSDTSLAPARYTIVAGVDDAADGKKLSIDYMQIAATEQTFVIVGAPPGRSLVVRAVDPVTGDPVSTTATATLDTDEVTLVFAPDSSSFALDIRAEQSYDKAVDAAGDGACDFDTPAFPVFTVTSDRMKIRDDGKTEVTLPEVPERIRYEGTIALCADAKNDDASLSLPIALHSRSLVADQPEQSSASLDVTTMAVRDVDTGDLRFCVGVLPGEYDLLVTPTPELDCGLFAEKRWILEAPATKTAIGALLELPKSASLKGTLRTPEFEPIAGVMVEAVSRGASLGTDLPELELAASDARLTRYNRSRQTTTDENGAFDLSVDLGTYDVMLKPPVGSGFAWQVRHDVKVGPRAELFAATIDMLSPVAVTGSLRYQSASADAQASLLGAEIEAFSVVKDGSSGERALAVGKGTLDADGRFVLLLPPATLKGW